MAESTPALPPIAALFLTHFDDAAGQSVLFYASVDDDALPEGTVEHASLPSGLHGVAQDVVFFAHEGRPAAGLFRSRDVDAGRGKRMGTVGVVLASGAPEDLFAVPPALEALYDRLEALPISPFVPEGHDGADALLQTVWDGARAPLSDVRPRGEVRAGQVRPDHPITYMPSLLALLGPAIVTVYKAAISNRRIPTLGHVQFPLELTPQLLYSPPPLLPLAAFSWCVWAMGCPPRQAGSDAARPEWIGNVGLMDLAGVLNRTGGWIATTSDAIYRSHPRAYDLFMDLSTPNPVLTVSQPAAGSGGTAATAKPTTATATYSFADLPLYRALLPARARAEPVPAVKGGLWLLFYSVAERAWAVCVGVAEYAIGRGNAGQGAISLGREGEEEEDEQGGDDDDEGTETDDAARRGRAILARLAHQTHHVYLRLADAVPPQPARGRPGAAASAPRALTDGELKALGVRRGTAEGRFWEGAAAAWRLGA